MSITKTITKTKPFKTIEDIITLGDMDNNNTINLSDVIILLKTYLGIY